MGPPPVHRRSPSARPPADHREHHRDERDEDPVGNPLAQATKTLDDLETIERFRW